MGALRWNVLLLGILASGLLVFCGLESEAWIIGLCVLMATVSVLGRFDLLHPYTWYCSLFFLYSVSTPVLIWLGLKEDIGFLQETVFLEWLAMATFVLVVGPNVRSISPCSGPLPNLKITAWVLLLLSLAVSALYLGHIWRNQLTSKYEIALSDSILARLDPAFSVFALVFTVLLVISFQERKFPWILLVVGLAWNMLAFLLSGERDLVFRLLWISVFCAHALYRPIPRWLLVIIAACVITLVPILSDLKNVLLREDKAVVGLEIPIGLRVLSDEFITGSENLQRYLVKAGSGPFYFGETLLWDLKKVVLPGFLFPGNIDPTKYFNELVFPEVVERGGGVGFTFVGEGYMNFAGWGVVVWFVLLGLFVRYLYIKGSQDVMWFVIYVVSMPLIAYVIRADFANLMSQFSKHIILPMILLFIGREILDGALRKSRKMNRGLASQTRQAAYG